MYRIKGGGVTIFVIVLKRIASCSPKISLKYIVVYLNQKHPKHPDWSHSHTNFLCASNGKLVKYRKIESSSPPHNPTSYVQLLPGLGGNPFLWQLIILLCVHFNQYFCVDVTECVGSKENTHMIRNRLLYTIHVLTS